MPRQKRESDANTEQRILEAARRVFVRRGTAGARMQEIAEEAGVNQALLHYYFRSKDRLASAVFREAATRLIPAVVQLLSSDAGLEERIERCVHLYIDTVRQAPFLPGYVLAELHHHPERLQAALRETAGPGPEAAREVMGRLRQELRGAAKEGRMRRIEPEQLLLTLLGSCAAPFLALPALEPLLGIGEGEFEKLLDRRRRELPGFILRGLRP